MGWMHRVREQHSLVVGQGIHEIFIARDESFLLLFVQLARDDDWLVILQPQTMQERDQSRAAFVNDSRIPSRSKRRSGVSCVVRPPRPRLSACLVARRLPGKRCRPPRNASTLRGLPRQTSHAIRGPYRRPAARPSRHFRNSSRRPKAPAHWHAVLNDAPPIRYAPSRSSRRDPQEIKSGPELYAEHESQNR